MINIVLIILYIVFFKKNKIVIEHKTYFKVPHYLLLISSLLISSRIYKLFYSRFAERKVFYLDEIMENKRLKILTMIISYASVLPSIMMVIASSISF